MTAVGEPGVPDSCHGLVAGLPGVRASRVAGPRRVLPVGGGDPGRGRAAYPGAPGRAAPISSGAAAAGCPWPGPTPGRCSPRFRPGRCWPGCGSGPVRAARPWACRCSALLDQQLDPDALRAGLPGGRGASLAAQVHGELAPEEAMRRLVRLTGEMVAGAPPDPLVAAAARRLGPPGARVGRWPGSWASVSASCTAGAWPRSATARCCCAGCCVSAASCPGSTRAGPWTTWPAWPPWPATPTRRT